LLIVNGGVLGMVFQVIHCLPNHGTCFYYCFHARVKIFWLHVKISLFTHCSTSKETSLKPLPKITKHSPKFWNGSPKKTHTHTLDYNYLKPICLYKWQPKVSIQLKTSQQLYGSKENSPSCCRTGAKNSFNPPPGHER
jgi:hypothetical protein